MAQTLSAISVNQSILASMSATGTNINSNFRIGRTKNTSITPDEADIVYSLKMTATAAADVVTFTPTTAKFVANSSATTTVVDRTGHAYVGYAANNGTPGTPTDMVGDAIPTTVTVVALYYETDSDNTGTVTIVASDETLGSVVLGAGSSKSRTALFTPRTSASGKTITFTFSANNDDVTLVVLANTS